MWARTYICGLVMQVSVDVLVGNAEAFSTRLYISSTMGRYTLHEIDMKQAFLTAVVH